MHDVDGFFRQVLKGLRPLLRETGFRSSSQNFVLESDECWAIINLQKSRWSQTDEKTFYVNVAVTAKRLLAFDDEPTDKAPAYYKCIWRSRAEHLGPETGCAQWTVSDEKSTAKTLESLRKLIDEYVVPAVEQMMSEEAILRLWTNQTRLGYQQLKAKSVLLAAWGNLIKLRQTLQTLKENFGDGAVAEGVGNHIERLRYKFPDAMREASL